MATKHAVNRIVVQTGRLICGSERDCGAFLKTAERHYVYILRRPDGRPFYVGKGVGPRVFNHVNEARHPNGRLSNKHKLNVIRSIQRRGEEILYEIDFATQDENAAFNREAELIGLLKRLHEGGPLTNRAPGGGSTSGPSPFSKSRHTATLSGAPVDNPERALLNGFVLGIGAMDSVVIKPISQFEPRPTVKFPNSKRKPSFRQAVALVAAAAANSIVVSGGCSIPRRVTVDGVDGLVENGVACDILTSGMASITVAADPADEVFVLSTTQAKIAIELVGEQKCADLGVAKPR